MALSLFKSRDKYFLTCKILTLLFCLPWPLTLIATVMSLAGHIPEGTSLIVVVLIRLAWLLALVYPIVFFGIVFFGERVVAPRNYALGAALALLPGVAGIAACVWIYRA